MGANYINNNWGTAAGDISLLSFYFKFLYTLATANRNMVAPQSKLIALINIARTKQGDGATHSNYNIFLKELTFIRFVSQAILIGFGGVQMGYGKDNSVDFIAGLSTFLAGAQTPWNMLVVGGLGKVRDSLKIPSRFVVLEPELYTLTKIKIEFNLVQNGAELGVSHSY